MEIKHRPSDRHVLQSRAVFTLEQGMPQARCNRPACSEIELQGKLNLPFCVARLVGNTEIGSLHRGIKIPAQYRMVKGVEELRPELKPSGLSERKREVPEEG